MDESIRGLRWYRDIYLNGLRKIKDLRLAGVAAEIRTAYLPNTSQTVR